MRGQRAVEDATTIASSLFTNTNSNTSSKTNTNTNLLEPRIVGGSTAALGAYPSYAIPKTAADGIGLCGSVKIWDDVLLTAAHCQGVFKGNTIYLGGNQRNGADALDTTVGQRELVHPDFSWDTLQNDFMLVKLRKRSTKSPNAPYNKKADKPTTNQWVTVIGFGLTEENGYLASDRLQEVDIRVKDQATCRNSYGSEFYSSSMLCASLSNRDSCQGDRYVTTASSVKDDYD